jgi:hypothetical protein
MWDECKALGWLSRHFHGCRWRYGNHGSVLLPRLQDLWDPPAQPAFTSPFVHHCMQRLKTASPCRTAESHGLGATLVVLKKGRPSWPTGVGGRLPQDPSTETAAVGVARD